MARPLPALIAIAALAGAACSPGGAEKRGQTPFRHGSAEDEADPTTRPAELGSDRCLPCHPQAAGEWRRSSHATSIRPIDVDGEERLASLVPCSDMTATHVLGERHHVRFLLERRDVAWGEGRWLALPCAWSVHDKTLVMHHADDWRERPLETSCTPCHVTRQDGSFDELGIGCESCHGPGGAHVAAPSKATIFGYSGRSAAEEVSTCASCHLQGGVSRRTGRSFPDRYTPGDDLFADYAFDWTKLDAADVVEAIDVHQKLLIRRVVVDGDGSLRCTSCHEVHEMTHEKHARQPRVDYCDTCHQAGSFALKEYRQSCPVCEF